MKVGVVIGRFQVPTLTEGHWELIRVALEQNDHICILIGIAEEQDEKNPLPPQLVKQAVTTALYSTMPESRFQVQFIKDIPFSDGKWSSQVDMFLQFLYPDADSIKLYGSRDGFIEHYVGTLATYHHVSTKPHINATQVRETLIKKHINSVEFRSGVIYGVCNYIKRMEQK